MKFQKAFIAISLAAVCAPVMAQYENTDTRQRIEMIEATDEEKTNIRQNLSLFQTAIESGNFQEAYESWKPVFEKAPFAQVGIYTNGAYMLFMMV